MNTMTAEPWNELTRHSAPGSVTVVCPLEPENPDRDKIRLRLRHQVEAADELLEQQGIDAETREQLLAPLKTMSTDRPQVPREGKTLFAFLSEGASEIMQLDVSAKQRVVVGEHFHVRPLLGDGRQPPEWYILTLADDGARLLRCHAGWTEDAALPLEREDRAAANGERVRPDGKGSFHAHGTSAGPKAQPQGFGHEQHDDIERETWYRVVLDALSEVLPKSNQPPLVVVTDKQHVGPFKAIVETAGYELITIQHNPHGMGDGELRTLAAPEVTSETRPDIEALGSRWQNAMQGGHCLLSAPEIVKAASEGRVGTLLFDPDRELSGRLDGEDYVPANGTPGHLDLVNEALRAVLLHGGDAVPVTPGTLTRVTGQAGAGLAAILRW